MPFTALDRPEILSYVFYPRKEAFRPKAMAVEDLMIPVTSGISIGGRLHGTDPSSPNILFFHGNGEIAADYDELAPLINQCGMNFIVVDYRGYGRSGGSPTVTAMMDDSHRIYNYLMDFLPRQGLVGPTIVMGRSLGSASALELAAAYPKQIQALIIDSGFAYTIPLLMRLGVDVERFDLDDSHEFGQIQKISAFTHPVLIIHGEQDVIIPFSDGVALYESSSSADKTLLGIPGAGHNDIFAYGLTAYMDALKKIGRQVSMAADKPETT